MDNKPKLKRQRMTGLFKRENDYGVYYTGTLDDGTKVIVTPPHPDAVARAESEGKTPPDMVLSKLVPEENT